MRNNIQKRTWGILGKQQTYYSPLQFMEGKTKVPLNNIPTDAWDYKKSKYYRIDLVPNEIQQHGVVPQATSGPAPSPTPTLTSTSTPTPSPTLTSTPTPTLTSTPTPTPTPSAAATDADANAYLSAVVDAGGTGITSTVSAATRTLFTTLKTNNIYNKIDALYLFLGGVVGSCKLNAKNPADTNAAFRLTFTGAFTFDQAFGIKMAGTTNTANTYWVQSAQTTSANTSIGFFTSVSGTAGYEMGVYNGTQWLALTSSNGTNMRGSIDAPLTNFSAQTNVQGINFNAISRISSSAILSVSRGGAVSSFASTASSILQGSVMGIGAVGNFGGNSNRGIGTAYISEGLDTTELGNLRDAITTFNTTLGRNL